MSIFTSDTPGVLKKYTPVPVPDSNSMEASWTSRSLRSQEINQRKGKGIGKTIRKNNDKSGSLENHVACPHCGIALQITLRPVEDSS